MSTQPFDESAHPRATGGRFATKVQPEAEAVSLAVIPGAGTAALDRPQADDWRHRKAIDIAERLVARRVTDGGFTATDRQDDVEDDMRAHLDGFSDEEFADHMSRIAAAAERVSMMERAVDDPSDTEAYDDLAAAVNADLSDFPVEDPEPEGPFTDANAYAEHVLAAHDERLTSAVRAAVEANERAFDANVTRWLA